MLFYYLLIYPLLTKIISNLCPWHIGQPPFSVYSANPITNYGTELHQPNNYNNIINFISKFILRQLNRSLNLNIIL